MAFDVIKSGGTAPCILNAANEIAVDKFINKKIKFSQISDLISKALDKIENHSDPDIETIFECDKKTREFVSNLN